jgi:hypothetical protein
VCEGITSQHDGVIKPTVPDRRSSKNHFALIERPLLSNNIFYNSIKKNKNSSTGAMS